METDLPLVIGRMLLMRLVTGLAILSFFRTDRIAIADQKFSQSGPRERFQDAFNKTCGKYPFVSEYVANLEAPSQRFMVYLFDEAGVDNGGLGDKLAGMISAVAFAMRTGRTLLIFADKAFEDAFQPYHPNNGGRYTWGNRSWSGWQEKYSRGSNTTHLHQCVNPRPSQTVCCLDKDLPQNVVRYRSNRAYLCRWVVKLNLYATSNLKRLGINKDTDLYEVSGCMLRLVMWPTERLWKALDKSLDSTFSSRSSPTSYQVGFHFRCGDKSFTKGAMNYLGVVKHNPECYYDPKVPWKGTNFLDDQSLDSPVDHAVCGKKILATLSPEIQSNAMVYIASDNSDSAQQINTTINWPFVVLPPKVCHVGFERSLDCTLMTLLHWFMLSLSDKIIMQGLVVAPGSWSEDSTPEDGSSKQGAQQGSISAFSRFAAIYGLNIDNSFYGLSCSHGNRTFLSRQTQGNWLCDPKRGIY